MYLQRLQLNGFKSFVDKTDIELGPGITCIVGPNGSGKSNIADAMRWVLGEQSAKSLRGTKMEDVIFAGSKKRKPVSRAEVSITLDNSSKMFGLDYSEITVTRRVFRSGESQYLINKVPSRLKDVHELFMDTGVGKESFAIIGQGKIEWIVDSTPEERRPLFEEAAGITKYRYRKKETLKKLENTEENLLRINDILIELENQLKPLEDDARKAEVYLSKKNELTLKEIKVQCKYIQDGKKELEKINSLLSNLEREILSFQMQEMVFKNFLEKVQLSKVQLENNITNLSKGYHDIEAMKHSVNSEILVTQEQIKGLDLQISSLDKEAIAKKEEIHNLTKQLAEQGTKLRGCQKRIVKSKEELDKLKLLLKRVKSKIGEHEKELNKINCSQIDELNILSGLKTDIANYENRKKLIEIQLSKNITKQNDNLKVLDELKENLRIKIENEQLLEKKLLELDDKKNILKEEKEKLHNDKQKLIKKKNVSSENLHRIRSQYKALKEMHNNMEGYYKGVKTILKAKKDKHPSSTGVLGVVAEILKVPPKYETAIEAALGGALQNIVTSSDDDAKKAISYLKMVSGGRATFLPLNTLNYKQLSSDYFSELEGVLGIASELVEGKEIYKPVIDYLLGRVILVENIENGLAVAKRTNFKYKIVTLEGDIFNPGGSISGGGMKRNASGILGRSRRLRSLKELELKEEKSLQLLVEMISKLEQNIEETNEKNKNLAETIESIRFNKLEIKQEVESVLKKIKENENILEVLKLEQNQMSEEIAEIKNLQDELYSTLKKKESQQKNSQEYLETLKEEIKNNNFKKESLSTDISRIEVDLGSLREQEIGIKNFVDDLKKRIVSLKEAISEINNQINTNSKKREYCLEKVSRLKERNMEIEENKVNIDFALGKMTMLNKILHEKEILIDNVVESLVKQIKILKNKIHKFELDKTRITAEISSLENSLAEQYNLSLEEINVYEVPEDIEIEKEKIIGLKQELASLGEVNIGAIDQYKKMYERYSFLSDQKKDLSKACNELKEVIAQVDRIMLERFQETFNQVNEYFGEIFRFLFNGGFACLNYSNEENLLETGIVIQAQPPGKKLQNLSLFSGGERALTAIALLFAFLKVKPSPFCILDEIEASLDEANVRRFAEFLHNYSEQTQFLVITHRQPTMELSDVLYGITMEEPGVSKLISIKLDEIKAVESV